MNSNTLNMRAMLIAAGIAGVVMGILSGLPFVNIVNCLLCMWVWSGGILSVWLYNRFNDQGAAADTSTGLIVGVVSGLIGGVVGFITGVAATALMSLVTSALGGAPDVETLAVSGMLGLGTSVISGVVWSILTFVAYPIFGAIGGVIGAELFKQRPVM